MFLPEMHFLVSREQHQDRLRDFERQQLVQTTKRQLNTRPNASQKAVGWLGNQMVKWGTRLQNVEAPPPTAATSGNVR